MIYFSSASSDACFTQFLAAAAWSLHRLVALGTYNLRSFAMIRRTLITLSVATLAGCSSWSGAGATSSETPATTDANRAAVATPTPEELAAYAGHAKFPADQQPKSDLQLASILSPDKSTIKIYNFTNDPLRNIDVWVNGSYVQHVDGISPQSSVLIHTDELYNGLGKSFSGQSEPVSNVQVATDHGLYNTWGPASD
jgi:hypothetical protein